MKKAVTLFAILFSICYSNLNAQKFVVDVFADKSEKYEAGDKEMASFTRDWDMYVLTQHDFEKLYITSLKIIQFDYEFGAPKSVGTMQTQVKFGVSGEQLEVKIFDDNEISEIIKNRFEGGMRQIEESYWTPKYSQKSKTKFIYDSSNNVTEIWYYGSDETPEKRDKLTYNDQGIKAQETRFSGNDIDYKKVYKYDDFKNEIELAEYNGKGKLESKTSSRYDSIGNKIEVVVYDGGDIKSKTKYVYDDKKNLIEKWLHDGDGSLRHKWTYKYNPQRKITEYARFESDQKPEWKTVYAYTKNDKLKSVSIYNDSDKLEGSWNYDYSSSGVIIRKTYNNNLDEPFKHWDYIYEPEQKK